MANLKISQLPSASSVTSDDIFPIVDSGSLTTQKASAQQVLNFVTGSTFNTLTVNNLTASSVTGSLAKFTTVSASTAEFSGSVLIYGTASLSSNPSAAYIVYSSSIDKLVAYPGLFVSGTISASSYLGLPTSSDVLPKLIVSSSVTLASTQRAAFANNSISSSVSITLPSAATADSRDYFIIKADSLTGSIFVSGSSPDLINGAAVYELNGPYQSITLIIDGTNWFVF
jgi:hypothetical protein